MNSKKLRIEQSINCSGIIQNEYLIPIVKEKDYFVVDIDLDGDAPKQFIKAYFFEPDSGILKRNPKTWPAFIAKSAEKWYPHESIIEYMINRIGAEIGLNMNECKLAKINGQIRFLSKYFLSPNESLIHGAEICGEHLGDFALAAEIAKHKPTARELFTFQFIQESIKSVFPSAHNLIMIDMVKMIAFDALVGNNDRHFYNWGVIDTKKRTKKIPTFAKIYDSSRGLLWNLDDANIIEHYKNLLEGGKKVQNYIKKAYPRISIEGDSEINHFELIQFISRQNVEYKNSIKKLACEENEKKIISMLEKNFYWYFIPERRYLITYIIKNRFETVRNITNE